jgi:RHS repeat-associated protein
MKTSIAGLADRTFGYSYDKFSRPDVITYPNGFAIKRQYHAAGLSARTQDVTDPVNPKVLWALGSDIDMRGNFNNQLWGNGVVTKTQFDTTNGQLKNITSGRLSATNTVSNLFGDIQALTYDSDSIGNLLSRTTQRTNTAGTAIENQKESFIYDELNRLTNSISSGGFTRSVGYGYNELGNLTATTTTTTSGTTTTTKISSQFYSRINNAGVHGITKVDSTGALYYYDKYGNVTKRGTETIDYDVFNKPVKITGATTTTFSYDASHARFRQTNGTLTTYTFAGGMYEEEVDGTKTVQKSYIDGAILNSKTINGTSTTNYTTYLHKDNLGSVEAYTDKLGVYMNRMSFSAWGKRQLADWKTGNPAINFPTKDGYTGHHQLDQHTLVHMDGRVYDPNIGRFLSADLYVQSPYSTQSYNRYSYASNNPMSRTDPSGYVDKDSPRDDLSEKIEEVVVRAYRDSVTTLRGAEAQYYLQGLNNGMESFLEFSIDQSGVPDAFNASVDIYIAVNNENYGAAAPIVGGLAVDLAAKKVKLAEKATDAAKAAKEKAQKALSTRGGSPALKSDPYHPDSVSSRVKPPYQANPAHAKGPLLNPRKTLEPADAKDVYSKAIRGDMGTWFGRGSDGDIYRYFSDNAGSVHFSGTISNAQVPNEVLKRL